MGTTADKLALLKASKEAIRDAITEKIGEDVGEVMSTYAEKIRGIESKPKYYRTTILLDQTITDPATMITKVYDDGGIDMIRANSHRYVCQMVDGVLNARQLQDNNGTLYLDGTPADLTGGEGDVFMKLPKFYYRAWSTGSAWVVDFAYGDVPNSDYYDWLGDEFIGVYEGYVDNDKLYSISGVESVASVSQSKFKEFAQNRGDGYSLVKWKHHSIMAFLFLAYYKNTDSQSLIGYGAEGFNSIMGASNLLGMEDTRTDMNGDNQSINFWGLECWWGNKYEWLDNASITQSGKLTITEDDGSQRIIDVPSTGSFISKLHVGDRLDAAPIAVAASASTGFCDRWRHSGEANVSIARSFYSNLDEGGIFYLYARVSNTTAVGSASSRLAYTGIYRLI